MKRDKVLIVEDDPTSREIVAKAVEKSNCILIKASNGEQAWKSFVQESW